MSCRRIERVARKAQANKRAALDPGPVAVLDKPERPRFGRGQ